MKELSKAITAFIPEPTLPLPDELVETIAAYLRRHPKYDDAAADRLQEELLSIFDKHAKGNPAASGPWIAIIRRLLPMIYTPERVLMWLDQMKGMLTERTSHEKGIVDETVAALMDLVALADEHQDTADADATINPIVHELFSKWMEKFFPGLVDGIQSMEFNERMFREALTSFGKRRPQQFFASLDSFFIQAKHRKAALRFLCDFVQNRPPHLHQILQSSLFSHLLTCLQEDTSTAAISSALTALVMLLPHMPSSLVPHLPTLFNIYSRLLFWSSGKSELVESTAPETERRKDWEVCTSVSGADEPPIAHLGNYYTILYGLYPINFMDYIRKPQRYLRHANVANADEFEIQATELRDQSEKFRRAHLLHPNFYTLTIESEKTDFGRWIKCEAAEVVAECMALCLPTDPQATYFPDQTVVPSADVPPVTVELEDEEPGKALLSSPPTHTPHPDTLARVTSTSSLQTMTRQESRSSFTSGILTRTKSRDSAADSGTLVQSTSHTQLQDLIQSNKAIKSGLHQPIAADSEGSAPPSHRTSDHEKPPEAEAVKTAFFTSPTSLADVSSQVAHLQRQNLMLQNDLAFERYQKQQHIAHIGELRRKQVTEAATEAETQNLIIMNRNLKNRFEEAKKAEMQVRKESEKSRALAKKWEADLAAKLKNLRDQSKETNNELQRVNRELQDARHECDKLRKLVCIGEVKELNWKQDQQSVEIQGQQVERLKAENSRLAIAERDSQANEQERLRALNSAEEAESKVQALNARLASHETELKRARKLFEAQIRELHRQLAEAHDKETKPKTPTKSQLDTLMAGSRAKQADMQKQYDSLMRKYVALQSSLLDMASGATPEQIKNEATTLPMGDYSAKSGNQNQAKGRSRAQELSEIDTSEATSYNVTPPLKEQGSSSSARPTTPGGMDGAPSSLSPDQRYFGRGGVQNRIRKEEKQKQKEEEGSGAQAKKKDKKSTGLRGIRTGVGEFVRGKTE